MVETCEGDSSIYPDSKYPENLHGRQKQLEFSRQHFYFYMEDKAWRKLLGIGFI